MAQPELPPDDPDPQASLRDRWWFSSALQVVAGAAVIGFQWGPISQGSANAANWLVALLGLLVLIYGVVGGLQASRQR
jgi:predicted secreted hydrolase